jgi:hypothetical protein
MDLVVHLFDIQARREDLHRGACITKECFSMSVRLIFYAVWGIWTLGGAAEFFGYSAEKGGKRLC